MSEMGHSHRRKMNPHSVYSDRVRSSIWDLCLIFVWKCQLSAEYSFEVSNQVLGIITKINEGFYTLKDSA